MRPGKDYKSLQDFCSVTQAFHESNLKELYADRRKFKGE